jgi:16S rRNA (uracil1498-N3)-methyltransferase
VVAVSALADLAKGPGVAMWERLGPPLEPGCRALLVGPEGGWSDEERAIGLPTVGLGGHVLRAETAAITAAVLLTAARG